jgi:Domain of unknown function (DUF4351)
LAWRDYLNRPNPVASALMAKMQIAPEDRVKVKIACLKMLAGLKLNPAQEQLISGFVDVYLRLNETEKVNFKEEVAAIQEPATKEKVMQITTSWELEGEVKMLLKQLNFRFGKLPQKIEDRIKRVNEDRIDKLGEALFGFNSLQDLETWLEDNQ